MSDRRNHSAARIEGIYLVILGIAMVWFSLFGNYEYIMNPRFRWLTVIEEFALRILYSQFPTNSATLNRDRP